MNEMHWIAEVFMGLGVFAYILGAIGCIAAGAVTREEGQEKDDPAERTWGAWIILGCPVWPVVAFIAAVCYVVKDIRRQRRESTKPPFFKDLFHRP